MKLDDREQSSAARSVVYVAAEEAQEIKHALWLASRTVMPINGSVRPVTAVQLLLLVPTLRLLHVVDFEPSIGAWDGISWCS